MNLPSMKIPSGETGSITESFGEPITKQAYWALEIATFKRVWALVIKISGP
jgi:hypothetical protein